MIISAMPGSRPGIEDIRGSGGRTVARLPMPTPSPGHPRRAARRRLPASAAFTYRVADGRPAKARQIVDGQAFCRLPGLIE
jgi:hypothetical protein